MYQVFAVGCPALLWQGQHAQYPTQTVAAIVRLDLCGPNPMFVSLLLLCYAAVKRVVVPLVGSCSMTVVGLGIVGMLRNYSSQCCCCSTYGMACHSVQVLMLSVMQGVQTPAEALQRLCVCQNFLLALERTAPVWQLEQCWLVVVCYQCAPVTVQLPAWRHLEHVQPYHRQVYMLQA